MTTTKTQEDLKAQLLQRAANALKTYYNCSGHTKAEGNKRNFEKFKDTLIGMGVLIPEDNELLKVGQFNGDGSW